VLSGIATELLGDAVNRVIPLSTGDAHELTGHPGAPLLTGLRVCAPADLAALEEPRCGELVLGPMKLPELRALRPWPRWLAAPDS